VQKRVDTGVWLITQENLDKAETQQLLHPPIGEFLN